MLNRLYKTVILVTIFSVAMAFLESAVVVYLRELYYPEGFTVVLKEMPSKIMIVELCREFATLIMLVTIGFLAGKNRITKFGWFLYSFAVWDIFYYVWLKIFIGWPASIFEWDILFLIPVAWLAPVLAPLICSVTMLLLSFIIIFNNHLQLRPVIKNFSWILIITGAAIIYVAFTKDYSRILLKHDFYKHLGNILQNPEFIKITKTFIPKSFSWIMFITGELLIFIGIARSTFSDKFFFYSKKLRNLLKISSK